MKNHIILILNIWIEPAAYKDASTVYADSSGPEFQSAIELGCEMALPFPFLDVMLVKKLQIQLSSPGKLLKVQVLWEGYKNLKTISHFFDVTK